MRKAASIQKLEREFDERAAQFLWRHPFLGFLAVFIGAPLLVLLCVCVGTALIALPVGWLMGWLQ